MKTFDHRAAFEDIAAPFRAELELAIPEIAELFARVVELSPELVQGPTLAVAIPDELLPLFAARSTRSLALAARAYFIFEHWSPGAAATGGTGAGWKFANMIDQVLAERLGLFSRFDREDLPGYSLRVIEGQLRAGLSTQDGWVGEDLGPASEEAIVVARHEVFVDREAAEKFAERAARARGQILRDDTQAKWFDISPFMVEEGQHRHDCKTCGKSPIWSNPKMNHDHGCKELALIMSSEQREKLARACKITIEITQDETAVRGNAMSSGDYVVDTACENAILSRLLRGDVWAWGLVRVIATVNNDDTLSSASSYLGAVSYADEDEFCKPGGDYEELRTEALENLIHAIGMQRDRLARLL